jgi:para-nitrobenzyl esterase
MFHSRSARATLFSAGLAAVVATLFSLSAGAAETIRLDSGVMADVAADASGVRLFKGIPFAAPPTGELRWQGPAPVKPWEGMRQAQDWGPRCMQSNRLGDIDSDNKRMDEDCLYLNVWTPAKSATDKLPVMVWIHGSSNNVGAGSQPDYHGNHLAAKGVIVVTVNYRLDVFGFLTHPELTKEAGAHVSGNYGLLDQVAALQWVSKNIAAFGGDPAQVTTFGESAGAFDVSLLMVSPLLQRC